MIRSDKSVNVARLQPSLKTKIDSFDVVDVLDELTRAISEGLENNSPFTLLFLKNYQFIAGNLDLGNRV